MASPTPEGVTILIYILSLLASVILSVVLTLFIQALIRGNPVGRMDFWVRKHLKSKNLEAKNLTFSNKYRLSQEQDFDYFIERIGLNHPNGRQQFNVKLQEISKISVESPSNKGQYLFVMKFNNKSVQGELEISFLNSHTFDDEIKVSELDTDMKITQWKYKNIPYILLDLISLENGITGILSEIFPSMAKRGDATLNIETNRTTPAMQYFSKLKTNLIVGTTDDLKVSLGTKNLSLTGTINGDVAKKISDIVIWYV